LVEGVAEVNKQRAREGKRFSIVAVAEGAMTAEQAKTVDALSQKKETAASKMDRNKAATKLDEFHEQHVDHSVNLTQQLEKLTGIESRLTILGHLQRGNITSAGDRLLATRLFTACAEMLNDGVHGVMVAACGDGAKAVAWEKVARRTKLVPANHPWL